MSQDPDRDPTSREDREARLGWLIVAAALLLGVISVAILLVV